MKHEGSCHCGAVKFEFDRDPVKSASRCNCTICMRVGQLGLMAKPGTFALKQGEESLSSYGWGAKISRRYFCKHCGIHCFARGHLEEVGGDYVSVNLNCVDELELKDLHVVYWDGRHENWEKGPRDTPWAVLRAE
jgi:hypothetical protein